MDEQTIKQVKEFQAQIAQLKEVITERDETIVALKGYLRLSHVDPDLLPA